MQGLPVHKQGLTAPLPLFLLALPESSRLPAEAAQVLSPTQPLKERASPLKQVLLILLDSIPTLELSNALRL